METWQTALIWIATAYAVFAILRVFGVFQISKSAGKARKNVDVTKTTRRAIKRETTLMQFYALPAQMFAGLILPARKRRQYEVYIRRLNLRNEVLDRLITPEEYVGKQFLPFVLSILLIPVGIIYPWVLLVPAGALGWYLFQSTRLKVNVADEDEILDDNFLDLYLLLYSQLKMGSRGRLRTTVQQYLDVLEGQASTQENLVLKNFAHYFLNLLATMEDQAAVTALRSTYTSSTIINFCNVAGQALSGIENEDNLLTFKMQLTERKVAVMRKKQAYMVACGNKAIYAIYAILFFFIIIGWWSKLPTDMLTTMF